MNTAELARLARDMRAAQRAYFRSRTPAALELSKALERQLDAAVARVLEGPGLFDNEGPWVRGEGSEKREEDSDPRRE